MVGLYDLLDNFDGQVGGREVCSMRVLLDPGLLAPLLSVRV